MPERETIPGLADKLRAAREAAEHEGSLGVIVPDAWVDRVGAALEAAGLDHEVLDGSHAEERILPVHLVPATVAKGLEFDQVVVTEPAAIADAEPDGRSGLRRLYVVLTRAVSGLTVVHARPLPQELQGQRTAT